MANVLNEKKKQQVLALGRLGWSLRRIQQETRIRRETASQYLKAAGIAVRLPGGWGRRAAKPANEVITDSEVITDLGPSQLDEVGALFPGRERGQAASPQRSPSASTCIAYREAIESGLSRGRNAMAIWQDLVSEYGFASSYQSVQRFARKLRGTQAPEARVVIETAPGEEAQVDYGTGPMVRDPDSGKYRRTRLFVLTLGHSRKSVRLLVFRSSSQVWAELHEKAFRRLGGVTRVVVLDNLREGVLTPDIYDPTLNPLYRDVLKHYGAVAMPCLVRLLDPRSGQLLREHLRQPRGGHRILDQDRSRRTPLGTQQLLYRAARAGAHIGALCQAMHGRQGEIAVRRILGVLALAKKYGVAATDDACAAALEVGVGEYRFVRRYLERNPQLPLSLRQVDPLIRQLTLYRDFIENKTKENQS